jgi:hypothetical protein
MTGHYFQGGPRRDGAAMARTVAAIRDAGLSAHESLMLSQLLLNLVGHAGRARGLQLIAAFLDAADVRWSAEEGGPPS